MLQLALLFDGLHYAIFNRLHFGAPQLRDALNQIKLFAHIVFSQAARLFSLSPVSLVSAVGPAAFCAPRETLW